MAYEETRTKVAAGRCPACQGSLEMVVAISLDPITINTDPRAEGAVSIGGKVVGAKTIEHDCLPRVKRRERGIGE